MLETPQILDSPAQPVAVIHLTIPRAEIQNVMRAAISEVMAAVAAQGIGPTGVVFSHHRRMDPETFDFEVGVPVSAPVTPVGRVIASELPAARIARTIYRGRYEGLATAWSEFSAWINEQGHTVAPNLRERYVQGPESGPEPSLWRTELNRPLIG